MFSFLLQQERESGRARFSCITAASVWSDRFWYVYRSIIDWFESSGWFEPMLMFYWTGDECCQLLIRTTYENVFVCQSNRLPDSCWWCSCGSDWLICQLISSLIKMIINMRTVKQQQWVFDCRLCYCLLLFKPKKSQWKIFLFLLPLMLETFHCFMLFFMLFVQHLWFDSEARCFHRFKKTNLQQKTVELSVTLRWLLVWIGI